MKAQVAKSKTRLRFIFGLKVKSNWSRVLCESRNSAYRFWNFYSYVVEYVWGAKPIQVIQCGPRRKGSWRILCVFSGVEGPGSNYGYRPFPPLNPIPGIDQQVQVAAYIAKMNAPGTGLLYASLLHGSSRRQRRLGNRGHRTGPSRKHLYRRLAIWTTIPASQPSYPQGSFHHVYGASVTSARPTSTPWPPVV